MGELRTVPREVCELGQLVGSALAHGILRQRFEQGSVLGQLLPVDRVLGGARVVSAQRSERVVRDELCVQSRAEADQLVWRLRDPDSYVQFELSVGELGILQRAGGLQSRGSGPRRMRQLRDAQPHVQRQLLLGIVGELPRSGGVQPGERRRASVLRLRHADAELLERVRVE